MKKRKARRLVEPTKHKNKFPSSTGFGYEVPPDFDCVSIYFNQKGGAKIAGNFFQYFQDCGWKTRTGAPVRNWKVAATDWIYDHCQMEKLTKRKLENII